MRPHVLDQDGGDPWLRSEITDLSWPDGNVALIVTGVVAVDTAEAFQRALEPAIGIGARQPLIELTECRLDDLGTRR